MLQLYAKTTAEWLNCAEKNIPILLSDHAHCERKAAQAAIGLMPYFSDSHSVSIQLARLAREEMRHFEQVLGIMKEMDIRHENRSACRYAGALHALMRKSGRDNLIDKLLVAAIIEARSCERFAALTSVLPQRLSAFYHKLWLAEQRHATVYVEFAELAGPGVKVDERLQELLIAEASIITKTESCMRFHSGIPSHECADQANFPEEVQSMPVEVGNTNRPGLCD